MAWSTPHVFVTGELFTAGFGNGISDNLQYLYDNLGGGGMTEFAEAYRSGSNQTIVTATWTTLQAQTEVEDADSRYDNATNFEYTVGTAGLIYMRGIGNIDGPASADIQCRFLISTGSAVVSEDLVQDPPNTAVVQGSWVTRMAAGATVKFQLKHNRGSDSTYVLGQPYASVAYGRIGD